MAFIDPLITVENDLVETLTAAVAGTKLRVDSLPGDWDDEMLNRLQRMAPCVLVAFAGGGPASPGAGFEARIDSQWLVYVVTAHPSGEAARRRGNAQGVGAYEILSRLVIPVLHNHVVPGVGSLALGPVQNLYTGAVDGKGLAVYAAAFQLPLGFPVPLDADGLDDFATFAAQFDIPPTGSSDAADVVTLPTA